MYKNPLNDSDVDGNTLLIPLSARSYYHCNICNHEFRDEEYNQKHRCCYNCWWKI